MKKLLLLFIIIIFSSQFINSQPRYIIHLTGSFNLPMNELAGDPANHFKVGAGSIIDENPMKVYEKLGFGFGADVKYLVPGLENIRAVFSLGYNMYSNNYAIPQGVQYYGGLNYIPKFNFITASIGGEYDILPKNKINPFFGIDLSANFYTGEEKFDPAPSNPIIPAVTTIDAGSRIGVQINAGADIKLNDDLGIICGARYHLINFIGKDNGSNSDTTTTGRPGRPLIDGVHYVSSVSTTFQAMSLNSLNFYAGVSFYFLQPKKKK